MDLSSSEPARVPQKLGQFDVHAQIAEGGMAYVYLGRSTDPSHRPVALKIVRPEYCRSKEFVDMFLDEAQIALRLDHPGIIRTFELGSDMGRPFLVMELLFGATLLDVWQTSKLRGVKLSYEILAWIGARLADALHYAHDLRDGMGRPLHLVHRDVNPANIFVGFDGSVKIIDFGLAKAMGRITSTGIGVVKGKLAYLAPEQARGLGADRRADIFALGVTLWELSLDRRLFKEDDQIGTLRRVQVGHVPDPTTIVADYPSALSRIVMRALASDPASRYPTAAEFARELQGYVDEHAPGTGAGELVQLMGTLYPRGPEGTSWFTALSPSVRVSFTSARAPRDSLSIDFGPERRMLIDLGEKLWPDPSEGPHSGEEETQAGESNHGAPASNGHRTSAPGYWADRDNVPPVVRARRDIEHAIEQLFSDAPSEAVASAEASLKAQPTAFAAWFLRQIRHHEPSRSLALIDHELEEVAGEDQRAHLLGERARLLMAGEKSIADIVAAWDRVLQLQPNDPTALKAIDLALRQTEANPEIFRQLAAHLGRMASAIDNESLFSASLRVEQARLFDRALQDKTAAVHALNLAAELAPDSADVRAAYILFSAAYRDFAQLSHLLAERAKLETNPERAAADELDAALFQLAANGDRDFAHALLEQAASRGANATIVRERVLDELIRLAQKREETAVALRYRRERVQHLSDVRAKATEYRVLARLAEQMGDREQAAKDLEAARECEPENSRIIEELDELYRNDSKIGKRIDLWTHVAAAAASAPHERGRALRKVAELCLSDGRILEAREHLRAALAADPSSAAAVDELAAALMLQASHAGGADVPTDGPRRVLPEDRERMTVLEHAARIATSESYALACLFRAALLAEELLDDPQTATRLYEEILTRDPDSETALLGLERVHARVGNRRALAEVLREEARRAQHPAQKGAFLRRAGRALGDVDADRAISALDEAIAIDPTDDEAIRLKLELLERLERHEAADRMLGEAIERAQSPEQLREWLFLRAERQIAELAQFEQARATLEKAQSQFADDPRFLELWCELYRRINDAAGLIGIYERRAQIETEGGKRASYLARAAEQAELLLKDDSRALALYARALAALRGGRSGQETPDEAWIASRLLYVLARVGREPWTQATEAFASQVLERRADDHATIREVAVLGQLGGRVGFAEQQIQRILSHDPRNLFALRSLEGLAISVRSAALVANALAQQADVVATKPLRLAILWAEAQVVEWKLPRGDGLEPYDRIAALEPNDRAAHNAVLRRTIFASPKKTTPPAPSSARALVDGARDPAFAIGANLLAGHVFEAENEPENAVACFKVALQIDPESRVAAAASLRVARRANDAQALVESLSALAEQSADPKKRADFFSEAALDARRNGAIDRARELASRSLHAYADCKPAVGLLIRLRREAGDEPRIVRALAGILPRISKNDVLATVTRELSRVAQNDSSERTTAMDALRSLLVRIPAHVGAILWLAESYIAQQAWSEAAEVLERAPIRDLPPEGQLAVLFALASICDRRLGRVDDAEQFLRRALEMDPAHPRVLRALVDNLQKRQAASPEAKAKVADALEALAKTQSEGAEALWMRVAEVRAAMGNTAGTELALIEAAANNPESGAIERLARLHESTANEANQGGYVAAVSAIVRRAVELGRLTPNAEAALGRLEIDVLNRPAEGVARLEAALKKSPTLFDARVSLARGELKIGQAEKAAEQLLTMILPDSSPLIGVRDPQGALDQLEQALAQLDQRDPALVVRELRTMAGGCDDATQVQLRARRMAYREAPGVLARHVLASRVLPQDRWHVFFDVANALAGVDAKLFRGDLAELGLSPRDRIKVGADHPLRKHLDRLQRVFGIEEIELAVSDRVQYAYIVQQDSPWLIAPSALLIRSPAQQVVALARPLTRLSLGMPWLDKLPPNHVLLYLGAAAKLAFPRFMITSSGERSEVMVGYEQRIARALGRRQKKMLSELAGRLADAKTVSLDEVTKMIDAVLQTEVRAGFLLTGDLLSVLDELRTADSSLASATSTFDAQALAHVLTHPLAGDVCRFALTPDAMRLRAELGVIWSIRARGSQS